MEPQRAIVSDVIAQLTRRGHADERVTRFSMTYLSALEKYAATPRRERHVASYQCSDGSPLFCPTLTCNEAENFSTTACTRHE